MVEKTKGYFEETRQVENMTNLRGKRNTRYHEKIRSSKKESGNFVIFL